jgi:hypothetical protein
METKELDDDSGDVPMTRDKGCLFVLSSSDGSLQTQRKEGHRGVVRNLVTYLLEVEGIGKKPYKALHTGVLEDSPVLQSLTEYSRAKK